MPPDSSTVLYEKRDRIAWVTLNRPEAMNARNTELDNALGQAMVEATDDDDVLVVIFTSAGGRAFCVGGDLKDRARVEASGEQYSRGGPGLLGGTQELGACPKPVIAAIDGYAIAGGMHLSARCDIRIATEKSRFGIPEARRSLASVNGIDSPELFLPRGEAMWVLLTGSHMTARRAYEIGFVQALMPDRESLFAEAERVANEIKLCAPLAVQAIKAGVKNLLNLPTPPEGVLPTDHAREMNKAMQERVARSEDRLEGPKAFAEKRGPTWKMR
jgi:enoyl-CoA hydratase/carnithine racemase